VVNLSNELTRTRLEAQNLRGELEQRHNELTRMQMALDQHLELKEKNFVTEQNLASRIKANKLLKERLAQLQVELSQGRTEALLSPRNDFEGGNERIIENLRRLMQEQINIKGEARERDIEEMRLALHDLKVRLANEQLQNESLQIKFKLIDQDNQSLRQTLVASSRRLDESPRRAINRVEKINELIANAQRNFEKTDILNWQKKKNDQVAC